MLRTHMQCNKTIKTCRSGFTLIELLVVIAIVAVIAAILFPVLTSARKAGLINGCISNMKQFNNAVNLYRSDNDGFLPQANNIWTGSDGVNYNPNGNLNPNYFEKLYPYMRSVNVAKCPAKPIKKIVDSLGGLWYYMEGGVRKPTKWHGACYTMSRHWHNKGRFGPRWLAHMVWVWHNVPTDRVPEEVQRRPVNPDTINYWKVYDCKQSEAIMLFCMAGTWTATWRLDLFPDGIAHGSHDKGTPALFADGHVKFVDYDQVGNF